MGEQERDWMAYKNKAADAGITLIGLTGATRSGKTQLAEWLERRDTTKIDIISQDDYYVRSTLMPKVVLQDAPFIKVAFWDAAECVDWPRMIAAVKSAIDEAVGNGVTALLIEGNMLVECEWLMGVVWTMFCLDVDKWTCFERRAEPHTRRQCYLPYMEAMWKAHCTRFRAALTSYGHAFQFIYEDALDAFLTSPDARLPLGSASEFVIATLSRVVAKGDVVDRLFKEHLNVIEPLPPGMAHIGIANDRAFFGGMLTRDGVSIEAHQLEGPLKRLMAMYLGVALGDASGAPYEFNRGNRVKWDGLMRTSLIMSGLAGVRGAPPGAVTDDFQMTAAALRTLTANNFAFNRRAHINAYIEWASQRPGGIGSNTRELFQHSVTVNRELPYRKYLVKFAAKHAPDSALSKSNGTLMRASAFVSIPNREQAIRAAVGDASISNNNSENRVANAVYVGVLHDLVYDGSAATLTRIMQNSDSYYARIIEVARFAERDGEHNEAFGKVLGVVFSALRLDDVGLFDAAPSNMRPLVNTRDRKGYVLVALWVAFRALSDLLSTTKQYGALIREIVELGGDTDTNAAIAGALIGAVTGLENLRAGESYNLEVLLNCVYRYSTLKVVEGLRPRDLCDVLALRVTSLAARTPLMDEAASDLASLAATCLPSLLSADDAVASHAQTTKKRKAKQRSAYNDDNDDDDDDDDNDNDTTDSFDAKELRDKRKTSRAKSK